MFSCLFIVARADLLALLYVMFYFVFVTFPCGVLGQVWCLIVSIPGLCLIFYFVQSNMNAECSLNRHKLSETLFKDI